MIQRGKACAGPEGKHREEFQRLKEIIDRPMGVLTATEMIMKKPDTLSDFAVLTSEGEWNTQSRAAWAIAYAAAKGVDIIFAEPALLNALSQNNSDLVKACAYALAHHFSNRNDDRSLDGLKRHRNADVRLGAYLAFLDLP